jgi:hypothetical protein
MICKKCQTEILGGLLACRACLLESSRAELLRRHIRTDDYLLSLIREGKRQLWVDRHRNPDGTETRHFAFECSLRYSTITFCGLNITSGKSPGFTGRMLDADLQPDPQNCPLCMDRLMNGSKSICAGICSLCGGLDGKHNGDCQFVPGNPMPTEEDESDESDELEERIQEARGSR